MKNVVVYTAIFGGYDFLYEPEIIPDNVDYICFTDNKDMKSDIWDVRYVLPLYEDSTRNARKYKLLVHRYLEEYDISIWVDGNFLVRGDVNELIDKYLLDRNFACYDHKNCMLDPRGCVYQEAEAILRFGEINMEKSPESGTLNYKDNPKLIQRQMERYIDMRYPRNNGLIVSGILFRKHNEKDVKITMEKWWEELKYGSKRDQLSFDYSAWKTDLKFNYIGGDIRDCRHFLIKEKHKAKIKVRDNHEPINLEYFLNMELQQGGGGKEVVLNDRTLKTVKEVVDFWTDKDIYQIQTQLIPSNWQYFNCMVAEFKKNVEDHHKLGWSKLNKEYFDSLEDMSDGEIEIFLKNNPVEFENGFIKHSYHRAVAMIGRLIQNKKYIPFYMKQEQIYDKSALTDNKHRIKYNVKDITLPEQLNIPRGDFTICQSGILALMGIRQNDDLDIIISSEARNQIFDGNENFIRRGNLEIFEKDKSKFRIFDAHGDDDLIENYSFQSGGYNFLEPRFYFSRKRKDRNKDIEDWKGIRRFFEMESYKGYPFNRLTLEQWGMEWASDDIH